MGIEIIVMFSDDERLGIENMVLKDVIKMYERRNRGIQDLIEEKGVNALVLIQSHQPGSLHLHSCLRPTINYFRN